MRRYIFTAIAALMLTGCEASFSGQPRQNYDSSGSRRNLAAVVFETRLSESSIQIAIDQNSALARDRIVFARMAEIDALYDEYETALLTEARSSGFLLSFAGVIAGLLGGFKTGETSQIYSLIGGGLAGAKTAYDQEILAESTVQAFIAQMRAGRSSVRAKIYANLAANSVVYPVEAAVGDLQRYRQAGTLAAAILGITEQAADSERAEATRSAAAERILFDRALPSDQRLETALFAYIAQPRGRDDYLVRAEAAGARINPALPDTNVRALDAVTNPANRTINESIARDLQLFGQ